MRAARKVLLHPGRLWNCADPVTQFRSLPRPQCHYLSSVALRLDQGFLKWDSGTACARICRICVKSSQILGCDQTPRVEPRQLSVSLRPQLVPPIIDV